MYFTRDNMVISGRYHCQEYIHRVGRTARGEGGSGEALLLLQEEECTFVHYLEKAKVHMKEIDVPWKKVPNIQPQVGI